MEARYDLCTAFYNFKINKKKLNNEQYNTTLKTRRARTRNVSPTIGYVKPVLNHSKFFPALPSAKTMMSDSDAIGRLLYFLKPVPKNRGKNYDFILLTCSYT